jgi:carboxylesterase type B
LLGIFAHRSHTRHENGRLPVLVWINGGEFDQGSGSIYNGESLMNRSIELRSPVIIVTVNYRLGFFGFSGNSLHIFSIRRFKLTILQREPLQ